MEIASPAWVYSQGGMLMIEEPLGEPSTEMLNEYYWPPVKCWGDGNHVLLIIYHGRKKAPYPYRVELFLGQTHIIYATDFSSYLHLLGLLMPLSNAASLSDWQEERRLKRQRKEQKRQRKLLEKRKKAKAARDLAPVSR